MHGRLASILAVLALAPAERARGQERGPERPPSIADKTRGMHRLDGLLPLYHDAAAGRLWLEIPRLGVELLHVGGLAAGLGSNDIGLDRGKLLGSRIVVFERVGPKVLMVQPNHRFRASSAEAAEVRAVREGFARSVLWGFEIAAETDGRVLVDLDAFLLHDHDGIAGRLRPGSYRLDPSRSTVFLPRTAAFPRNTEVEVELTFARANDDAGRRGGEGRDFAGVGDVAAAADAASLRVHHSFVALPDDGYRPRAHDPSCGFFATAFRDYSAPLGAPMERRLIHRHRLRKADPTAAVSAPVEPIVYHLDPGVPEPIRSALLDGARWWNRAFEAAGYENAFRVELLPDGASPLDARYHVINWVHRSTRGWSYGGTVTDPRTGEIIKGVVTLGSLRVRQDYLIAEGLLAPYATGDEDPPELAAWALARIRQLAAHEVGHTLGLAHNYYDSRLGRISVMDYPHPLLRLADDGTFDHSEVYAAGIGAWDEVAIAYGYADFPPGTDEAAELRRILDEAWARDLRFFTDQDTAAHPKVDQWANGTDAAAELTRMLGVRRAALDRFGANAIRRGAPLASLEEALVPLFLHHRYQVEAAASVVAGLDYTYAMRGDGRPPVRPVAAEQQRTALAALLSTLAPAELAVPRSVLALIPPRPAGHGRSRELFPRYTGPMFDAITPAVVAAKHTVAHLLDARRAARLVEQHALDPGLPGLREVLDALRDAVFGAVAGDAYEAEIQRAAERVLVDELAALAGSAPMPQVRAVATAVLAELLESELWGRYAARHDADARAHIGMLQRDVRRFLERTAEGPWPPAAVEVPPGAPIGDPAPDWLAGLRALDACSCAGHAAVSRDR